MKEFTHDDARRQQNELVRALDKLGDDFTYAEFQQAVYKATNYFPTVNEAEDLIGLHRPIYIKEKEYIRNGKRFGLSGSYVNKPDATLQFNGHYTKSLLIAVKGIAAKIKSK